MDAKSRETLKQMFCPKSIAIIGATREPNKFGGMFLKALLDIGYEGDIYPVNPSGGEAMGLKMYPNLKSIGKPIDLACICVPREKVVDALKDSLEYDIPGAEILTAGFREAGDELGMKLEREIIDIAGEGIRVLGPNCFGLYCPECGMTILPGNEFGRKKGPVAFISQSGGVCADLGQMAPGYGVGFTQMVSYGNASDIDEVDLIEYFTDDPDSRIIAGYIEGVKDGRRFFEAVKKAAIVKPVVIWKAGLSEAGSRAVVGHTGSMAGDRALWTGLARQANVTLVSDMQELLDIVMAFRYLPAVTGERLAVIGGGGAISVFAADMADEFGLKIPRFSKEIKARMERILPPPGNNMSNPCDVGNPLIPSALLGKVLDISGELENIDMQVVVQIPYHIIMTMSRMGADPKEEGVRFGHHGEMVAEMRKIRDSSGKPMTLVMRNIAQSSEHVWMEDVWRRSRDMALEAGIPVYPDMKRAFRALSGIIEYYRRRGEVIKSNG